MRTLLASALLATSLLLIAPACAQEAAKQSATVMRPAPYRCEGCSIVRRALPDTLDWQLAVARDDEPGERLALTGRVLHAEGQPAPGVALYVHQTDATGIYRQENGTFALHGWLTSGEDGRYRIETIRPGPYPSRTMPAHIHVYVGEPDRQPYYLNDFVFDGDPLLTPNYLAGLLPGPDNGVVRLARTDDGWRGERDLILPP